jgi:hypothetical protein
VQTNQPGFLKFPDDFFSGKFSIGLGREIIRRHEAGGGPAPDESAGLPMRRDGGTPKSRSTLVRNDRKLRYLGQNYLREWTPRS